MSSDYIPGNHYWIVEGDETKRFSSAAGDYVPADDATYLAWVDAGGVTTRIANDQELGEVLADARVRPENAQVLDGFKGRHADKLTFEIVAKLLLYLINEVRDLKGQNPVTAKQFKNFVKDRM